MADVTEGIYAYFVVFAALVAAAFGFPIPEEIPVITGGGWCAHAAAPPPMDAYDVTVPLLGLPMPHLDAVATAVATANERLQEVPPPPRHPLWYIMLPVCILGVILCDGLLYSVGRIGGPHLLEIQWVKKWIIPPDTRDRIETNFHRYGVRILFGARLLPGVRAPLFVIAGVMRLPFRRFLLADGTYAVFGVSLLFFLAYYFTNQIREAVMNFTHRVDSLRPLLIIGGIAAVAGFLLYEFWKRRHLTGDPKEVPIIGQKVIKPAEKEPFPDSVILKHPSGNSEPAPAKKESKGVTRLMTLTLLTLIGALALYEVTKRRS